MPLKDCLGKFSKAVDSSDIERLDKLVQNLQAQGKTVEQAERQAVETLVKEVEGITHEFRNQLAAQGVMAGIQQLKRPRVAVSRDSGAPPTQPPKDPPTGNEEDVPFGDGSSPKNSPPEVGNTVANIVRWGWRRSLGLWMDRLYQTIAREPGGKRFAEQIKSTVDRAKTLMNELAPYRTKYLRAVRGRSKEAKAARASLEQKTWDGDWGDSHILQVLGGKEPAVGAEKAVLEPFQEGFYKGGTFAERAGMSIQLPDGKEIKFKADPNRFRAPRMFRPEFYWYMRNVNNPSARKLFGMIAEANNLSTEAVVKAFTPYVSHGLTAGGQTETAISIEHMPAFFKDAKGRTIQLLETNPLRLIDHVTQRLPQRVAFVEHFRQHGIEKDPVVAEYMRYDERGAEQAIRALNGRPVYQASKTPSLAEPGSVAFHALELASIPWNALKSYKLATAWIPNSPESYGKANFITNSNALTVAKAQAVLSYFNRNRQGVIDDLEARAGVTRSLTDWFIDKSNIPETINRYIKNGLGLPTHLINEFNEQVAGHLADQWAARLQRGKGGSGDAIRLRILGFTEGQRKDILSGEAEDKWYTAVRTRAVEWSQGSTSLPVEKSRAGNSKVWTALTIADAFSQFNVNRNFYAMSHLGRTLIDPKATIGEKVAAVRAVPNLVTGQLAAGAFSMMARALLLGTEAALVDKALGSPTGFADWLLDAATYAFAGSATQAMVSLVDRDPGESAVDAIANQVYALSVTRDMADFVSGQGRYAALDPQDRTLKYLTSAGSLAPMAANVAGMIGIGAETPALKGAMQQYYEYRRRYDPIPSFDRGPDPDWDFHVAMKKAQTSIQRGDEEATIEALKDALGVKEAKNIRQSLESRRLLARYEKKPEVYEHLSRYLGPDSMAEIQRYDALLKAWADALK